MRAFLIAVLLCGAGAAASTSLPQVWPGRAEQAAEPERAYTLHLGERAIELRPGQEIQLEGRFEDPRLRLELGATRFFGYGGVHFEYPAAYLWEADVADPNQRLWTMDGAEVTLMVFRQAFAMTPEDFAGGLESELEEVDVQPTNRRFGGQELRGVVVAAEVAGTTLLYDVLAVPGSGEGSTLLILLDATDRGVHTAEYQELVRLLERSFRVGGPELEKQRALEAEIAELEAQIEVFAVTYTDEQPIMKELRERLARARAELARLRAQG